MYNRRVSPCQGRYRRPSPNQGQLYYHRLSPNPCQYSRRTSPCPGQGQYSRRTSPCPGQGQYSRRTSPGPGPGQYNRRTSPCQGQYGRRAIPDQGQYNCGITPEQHRQLLTQCANQCSQDMDAKACDDEVAEIMKIAERLQDCICQKYGSMDEMTGQVPRCRMCVGQSPGLSVDVPSSSVDSPRYSSGPNSPEPRSSESYIARRIEHHIQALTHIPLSNHLMSQADNNFEPVSCVTDDPSGDPYNYQTSTPSSAISSGVVNGRRLMKPKVIPPETFIGKYYHPYRRQEDRQSKHPAYDHIQSNRPTSPPANQSRRPYISVNSSHPYDSFTKSNSDAKHPYRKYMKRPNTANEEVSRTPGMNELFRAVQSQSARASACGRRTPQCSRPRSRGVRSDAGNDVGYDVDKEFLANNQKQSNMLSTGFEIVCNVLRKLYI